MTQSKISICLLYPDLLGTYGDGGNATVLAKRLEWRNIPHEVVRVHTGEAIPAGCDIYLLGGGEDQPQATVADQLVASGSLNKAVDNGAVVLAVCAGMQVIGTEFDFGTGVKRGAGILDLVTRRGEGKRRLGEIVVEPDPEVGAEALTGFENHGGITKRGADLKPLGKVTRGTGNDDGTGTEGALQGKVIATYLHGPVLTRNPELADRLLSWATNTEMSPLEDAEMTALRKERFASPQYEPPASDVLKRLKARASRFVQH